MHTKSHLGVCRVELNIAGYHFLATIHMQTYFLKAYVFFWFFFPFQNIACHSFSTFQNMKYEISLLDSLDFGTLVNKS